MSEVPKGRQFPEQMRAWQHCVAFLLACLILVTRRPDAIFHPQFCYEDGHVFFAEAYNFGWWHALLRAYDGYFHLVPRLAASLALLAPLTSAVLVMNILAILVQAIPVSVLLSARSSAWGSLPFRVLIAAVYLALPDNAEITFGITWAQWPLALVAILLIVASTPKGWIGRACDCVLLLFAGLSGPACVLILPIAVFLAWKRKETWRWVQCAILTACSLIQAWSVLIFDPQGRSASPLGISTPILVRILGGNIFAGALLGRLRLAAMPGTGTFLFLLCAAIGGAAIMIACFLKSQVEMKLFLVFTCMLLAASLLSPTGYPPAGTTIWQLLAGAPAMRYWFMPSLAFAWALLWCARNGNALIKSTVTILLCTMVFGIALNWKIPAFEDFHFDQYAKAFDAAPPGTVMVIPEFGPGWTIELVKHASH